MMVVDHDMNLTNTDTTLIKFADSRKIGKIAYDLIIMANMTNLKG